MARGFPGEEHRCAHLPLPQRKSDGLRQGRNGIDTVSDATEDVESALTE
jgi:hypothetical protein